MWKNLQTRYGFLLDEPFWYGWAGLLAAMVLGIIFWRLRRLRRPIVLYRSEGGNVEIARPTLRGLIIGAALQVPGVEMAACLYDQRGRKLRVTLFIHLAGDARLTLVEEEMKKRIRFGLQQQVGYAPEDVQPINVRVTKIVGEPGPLEEDLERKVHSLPTYSEEPRLPEAPKTAERD